MFENFFKKICFKEENQATTASSLNNQETYTPTYQLIARDLKSTQDAVFEAAVYYLCGAQQKSQTYRRYPGTYRQ